jgi:hypothetical protein
MLKTFLLDPMIKPILDKVNNAIKDKYDIESS